MWIDWAGGVPAHPVMPWIRVDHVNKACRQLGALVGWAEQWMVKKSGAGSLDAFGAGSGRDQFQSRHDVIPSSRA